MLDKLKKNYSETGKVKNDSVKKYDFELSNPHFGFLYDFIKKYGGTIFNNGLLKIQTFESSQKWTDLLTVQYFEEFTDQLYCFAFNWQGCMFCINKTNSELYIFDPATCEYFSMENISLSDFFNNVIFEYNDETLVSDYFEETIKYLKIKEVNFDDSFGHKNPLFLGGIDDVENYEITDTEVLWELQIQISENINEIPDK